MQFAYKINKFISHFSCSALWGSVFLLFISLSVYSQTFKCGTELSPEYMKQYRIRMSEFARTRVQDYSPPCINKTLSIIVHIVKDSLGNNNVVTSEIEQALDDLNTKFKPICLQFKICGYDYIENFQFDTLTNSEEAQLRNQYEVKNMINWYFVEFFKDKPAAAGYAYGPGGFDDVFYRKKDFKGATIPHEMGHFFGLPHTFETSTGNENVVRTGPKSNCSTTGDLLCDTYADPYPNAGMPDPNCEIISTMKDANGDFYLPPTNNIMSYYVKCASIFTPQQYFVMADSYLNIRFNLW